MADNDDSQKPRDAMHFEAEVPASPARVRALAEMVQAGLTAVLGRPPHDEEFTLVVSNRALHGHLRGWTDEAVAAGRELERITRDPTRMRKLPPRRMAHVAKALRTGYELLRSADMRVLSASKSATTPVDAALINSLRGLEADDAEPLRIRGDTESLSPIASIRRRGDGLDGLEAQIQVDPSERGWLPLDAGVVDIALEAFKRGCFVRATIDGVWQSEDGDRFQLVFERSRVVDLTFVDKLLTGTELLDELAQFISPDEADAVAKASYEESGIDWQELQQ